MMAKILKCSVLFLSLLPVVLPCIYASELFTFDRSKEKDDEIAKSVEDGTDRVKNTATHDGKSSLESQKARFLQFSVTYLTQLPVIIMSK